ncbi:unnamed protein product, partial [marine sediment metagenome]
MSDNGNQDLKIYEVTQKLTGEKRYQAAVTTEDACKQTGWLIADCFAIPQKPRYKSIPDHEGIYLVRLPCLTCPFQYAECLKPDSEDCPTRPNAPELQEWLKQAAQAHLCTYVGQGLAKA